MTDFPDVITPPLACPGAPIFSDRQSRAIASSLTASDEARPGDLVAIEMTLGVFAERRGRLHAERMGQVRFAQCIAHETLALAPWAALPGAQARRAADLAMELLSGPIPLSDVALLAACEGFVDDEDTRGYADLVITRHCAVLMRDNWREEILEGRYMGEDFEPWMLEDCFWLVPHAPVSSAHDAIVQQGRIGRDRGFLVWLLACLEGADAPVPDISIPALQPGSRGP